MKNRIKFIRRIQVIRSGDEPGLIAIRANGLADLTLPLNAYLAPCSTESIPDDGIMEMDFRLAEDGGYVSDIELDVEVVVRIKDLPDWVRGFRINAEENSDIELI